MATRLVVTLGAMMAAQRLDFEDPTTLMAVRTAYYGVHIILAAIAYLALQRIDARKDLTPVWIPVTPAGGLMGALLGGAGAAAKPQENEDPSNYQKTTYHEHERSKANELLSQTMMGMAMMSLFHFKFGIHLPLVLQVILGPLNAWSNPVVRKHVIGDTTDERPWKERLTDPASETPVASVENSDAQDGAEPTAASSTTTAARTLSAEETNMEEAIYRVWESDEPLPAVSIFEGLSEAGVPLTFGTREGGWTPLMVLAGRQDTTAATIERMIELGAESSQTDEDGWTAVHWASFHSAPQPLQALLARVDADTVNAVLMQADKSDKTPIDLAKGSEDKKALPVLLEALERVRDALKSSVTTSSHDDSTSREAVESDKTGDSVKRDQTEDANVAAEDDDRSVSSGVGDAVDELD